MNEKIKPRYCIHCGELIPETRRLGCLYCTPVHGWTFRNRRNAFEKENLRIDEHRLRKNLKIIKDQFNMGHDNISKETALALGFDFECFTGIIGFNEKNKTPEYKIFDYSYAIDGERIMIKKII
jgi:hypothetical protein